MSLNAIFLTAVGLTLLIAISVVICFRRAFDVILVDLCGTQDRAYFWRVFSSVMIVLVRLWRLMGSNLPSNSESPVLFLLTSILENALAGLLAVLVGIGTVLALFIGKQITIPVETAPGSHAAVPK